MSSTVITENKPVEDMTDKQTSETKTNPLDDHSHTCDDPTHHHNFPSFMDQNELFSNFSAPKNEIPVKRKSKKNKQQGVIRAELIPGNRGEENIDDLVKFINSPASTNDKKQKKKTTTTTN
jgi:hypothetical protein